ncbi:MAG: carboxylating.nicotinate-nucleotide diphosphorylase, partial [Candidatus Lokiarchaeota archaeon]|nr:carboxylating.nicotinate-nucleotide diphosphorylase [Candidatus Lokiarchaeota archaeon]
MDTISNIEKIAIKEKLIEYLEEDIGYGDITTEILPNKKVNAKIFAKTNGVICGVQIGIMLFDICNVKATARFQDGDQIKEGDVIMELQGKIWDILKAERTCLNIMMRMSSIASSVNEFNKKLEKINLKTRIAASRKTTPGFRYFEKKAVIIGGGDPHRWRLDDM